MFDLADILAFCKDWFYVILLVVVALVVAYYRYSKSVTFYIVPSEIDTTFVKQVRDIIMNSELYTKFNMKEVMSRLDNPDITINLTKRADLDKYHEKKEYYPDGSQIRFSITEQSAIHPPQIYIDEINWIQGVKQSGLTLSEYREYVVNHEVGHGCGLNHQPCNKKTAVNQVCPVMHQSTKSCPSPYKCGHKFVPADYTKKLEVRYLDLNV